MKDIETRTRQCFAIVFPGVASSQLAQLSQATCAQWDSVGHVTLIATLSEEFDADLEFDAFSEATDYAQVLAVLQEQLAR
jgi:acyl carrier protein